MNYNEALSLCNSTLNDVWVESPCRRSEKLCKDGEPIKPKRNKKYER